MPAAFFLSLLENLLKRYFLEFFLFQTLPNLLLMKYSDSSDRLYIYPTLEPFDLDAVYQLTYDTYLKRGICFPNRDKKLVHNPDFDVSPNTHVLVAKQKGRIEASLSITFGYQREEVYNYEVFKEDLAAESFDEVPFFSAWRLAVKNDGPSSRCLVLQLILKAIQLILQNGATFGYMSFREEHLQFYKRILPEGYLVGRRIKQTKLIHSELCLWKCYLSEERYSFLNQLVLRLSER